ncbi:carbonic anhydrase IV a precursor, partial [Silurus asotus]
ELCLSFAAEWCYQSQVTCDSQCKGPDSWHELNGDCKKNTQSPINIVTRKTILDHKLTPFIFSGYQEAFSSTMKNNGHTVSATVPQSFTVRGGNLESTYKAVQFHFHWGVNGSAGSEHTIDGEQYPMEMHIVHMKEEFDSLKNALMFKHGVAVLGFFYEKSNSANSKYGKLIEALTKLESTDATTTLSGLSLSNLLPSEQNMTNYYRYEGSLTTPNCTEGVVWTVFEHPIPLSNEQLVAFTSLKFKDGKPMIKTFRPVQPNHGNPVYRSGCTAIMLSYTVLLACACSALGLSRL